MNTEKERYDTFTEKQAEQQNAMHLQREKLHGIEQEISVLQDKYDAGKRTLDQNLINARFMAEQLLTIEATMKNAEVYYLFFLSSFFFIGNTFSLICFRANTKHILVNTHNSKNPQRWWANG